jgi:hypothetical protein
MSQNRDIILIISIPTGKSVGSEYITKLEPMALEHNLSAELQNYLKVRSFSWTMYDRTWTRARQPAGLNISCSIKETQDSIKEGKPRCSKPETRLKKKKA